MQSENISFLMLWKGIVALPACKYWSCHKSYIWVQQRKSFQIKMSIKRWAFVDQNPPWIDNKRKQPPEVFYKKNIRKNFAKFTRKHLCQSLFAGHGPATWLKKRLWHGCFPVNFAKFLRTPFSQNTYGRLLLQSQKTYAREKQLYNDLNPIQDRGWGTKSPPPYPTSFFPLTSTNIGISSKNFLTFSFELFATLV